MKSKSTLFTYEENIIKDKGFIQIKRKETKMNNIKKNSFIETIVFFLSFSWIFSVNGKSVQKHIEKEKDKNIKNTANIIKKEIKTLIKKGKKELAEKTALTVTFKHDGNFQILISGEKIKCFKAHNDTFYLIDEISDNVVKYFKNRKFNIVKKEQPNFKNVATDNGKLLQTTCGKDVSFIVTLYQKNT